MAASLEERLPYAMKEIFSTAAGAVLHGYLTERAMTMSALSSAGVVSETEMKIHEGRRYEAILLLGAPNTLEKQNA